MKQELWFLLSRRLDATLHIMQLSPSALITNVIGPRDEINRRKQKYKYISSMIYNLYLVTSIIHIF